ncbi:MAG TPA: ribosome maturation factor RimP, partial [Leptospiraceae bacterium]|nr:ribosome maturation factor RimP [Leptospiraceae bacterium]
SDCEVLSKELTVRLDELYPEENYTIQISSAGAERQLRLPKDLYRFKDLPMKMFFLDSTGVSRSGIFNILHLDEKEIEIQTFLGKKKSAKKGEVFKLQISDIQKGNLYMEF